MNKYLIRIDNPRRQNRKPASRRVYEFHENRTSTFIDETADLKYVPADYRRRCLQRRKERDSLLAKI